MVIFGLLLIVLGVLAILAGLFVSKGQAELLGFDLSAAEIFVAGVVAGAFILWGFTILKYGTKRGLRHRQERKKISELSEKLDRAESERDKDNDDR
jgi:hypothetical protein